MPDIQYNFENDVLNLISTDQDEVGVFDERKGHYVRISVYDTSDNLIRSYSSHLTWDNPPVYYDTQYQPHINPTFDDEISSLFR